MSVKVLPILSNAKRWSGSVLLFGQKTHGENMQIWDLGTVFALLGRGVSPELDGLPGL